MQPYGLQCNIYILKHVYHLYLKFPVLFKAAGQTPKFGPIGRPVWLQVSLIITHFLRLRGEF
jgi:hypothetical protein